MVNCNTIACSHDANGVRAWHGIDSEGQIVATVTRDPRPGSRLWNLRRADDGVVMLDLTAREAFEWALLMQREERCLRVDDFFLERWPTISGRVTSDGDPIYTVRYGPHLREFCSFLSAPIARSAAIDIFVEAIERFERAEVCERCGVNPAVSRGNGLADWCDACMARAEREEVDK